MDVKQLGYQGTLAAIPCAPLDVAIHPDPDGIAPLEEMERRHIVAALECTAGVIHGPKGAARILKVHPNTLRSRMEKLGITFKRTRHET